MDVIVLVATIASLFVVIGAAEPLAERLRLPYTVILACLGILIGIGASFLVRTDLSHMLDVGAEAVLDLPIGSHVFLYVFLPTLIFQATIGMNVRRILDDWVPILVLAVVAVIVATLAVGHALALASGLPLAACLLVGAIVSTTDPSAVVGVFRSIAAPQRLARIIEGESLMNDAAAIALWGVFLGAVTSGVEDPTLLGALARFPLLLAGGAVVGWALARVAVWLMASFGRLDLAQISVSVALPYLAFIVAEEIVGASGVIAVVAAGLTVSLLGPGHLSPLGWQNLRDAWDLLAHWAGALLFILAALLIPRLLEDIDLGDLMLIGVVTLAAFAARALILFGLLPLLALLRVSPAIGPRYRTVILWGGLRGAVTLALALAVTESWLVAPEVKRLVGILAVGFLLFTLLVQGTTLRLVISRLGLDRLTPLDTALSNQVIAVSLQTVREDLAQATGSYRLTREIVRSEAKRFAERLDKAVRAAEADVEILERDRVTLGLIALAGAERDMILTRFRDRTLSSRQSDRILRGADQIIEGTRAGGRTGYLRASRLVLNYGLRMRAAVWLSSRLGLSRPLARLTVDRFERLLATRLIMRDLHGFVDRRIRRIHGKRIADLLHDLLARRSERVEEALEALRLQYPGYAEELERRFIRRMALRLEEREYEAMHDDGLIGPEVHTALVQDLARRRARSEPRPKLDVAVRRPALVRQFELFADLDESTFRQMRRALRTRYADAGEVLLHRDRPVRSVFFIASGAVELTTAGTVIRLGRGEIFGQLSLLMRDPPKSEARAIAPSTLLVLDETRLRRLLARSPALRDAIERSATRRGLSPDVIDAA